MKKILTLGMFTCLAVSLFAIDFSIGGGLDYTGTLESFKGTGKIPIIGTDVSVNSDTTKNFLGAHIFFDATYIRLGLGADFSVNGSKTEGNGSLAGLTVKPSGSNADYRETNFDISILGKYPFKLGLVDLYPMLGFDFAFNVAAQDGDTDLRKNASDSWKKDMNHYYFVLGLGADVNLGKFFINPTASFGVDLKKPSTYNNEKKAFEYLNDAKVRHNNFMFNVGLGFGYRL